MYKNEINLLGQQKNNAYSFRQKNTQVYIIKILFWR